MAGRNVVPSNPPVVLTGDYVPTVDPGGGSSGPISTAGVYFDWLIDGVPFLLWPSEDDAYVRDTKEDVKEQFDSSREAGEQSFGYWWLRSQASYHGGAGQNFLDTESAEVARLRYFSSNYLNPWTPGELSVNPGFSRDATAGRADAVQVTWGGTARLAAISGIDNTVTVWELPSLTSPLIVTLGLTGICQSIAADGENLFIAVADKVYKVSQSGAATQIANVPFVGPVVIGYAKQRVILATGPKVYEIDPNAAAPATPTAIFTHPSANWQYTAVADGPNGIYVAGFLGPLSELSLMTVQTSGTTLTLSQPVVQLRTPPSEIIWDVAFYLNAFFGLATSNGIRVGQFTPYGQPQYGPVLNPGNPVRCVTGSGTLLYFGGTNRIWTVDLGTQVADGRYAHALYGDGINPAGPTDNVIALAAAVFDGDDRLFGVQAGGSVFYQSSNVVLPAAGTLTTSWARFGTVEPKRMHYIRVEGAFPVPLGGGPALTIVLESITGQAVTIHVPGGQPNYEFRINSNFTISEAFRLKFTIPPTTTMRSWQMKSRPAPVQYQEFILPLACWDRETGADGQEIGYPGYAVSRLLLLEEAARSNRVVTALDRNANVQYQAQISRCQYRQSVQPGRTGRDGGKVTLILRLV